jgi:16S rRNA (cytidine1402-2'-O)-methyltransferase
MSTLFLVATPIGNLEDISARALRVLREARLIACEDTRHTGKLLHHFEIDTPTTSYFEHNELHKLETILAALAKGDVALVSDAGTPGINDPGFLLVRAALDAGHAVSPVPGPSAPIAALVSSGLPADRFLYLGYLPRKQGDRLRVLEGLRSLPYTLVFLESPHRMDEALADIAAMFGERAVAVAGELTKMYEEIFRGTLAEAIAHYQKRPARGEYTLVVAGASDAEEEWTEESLRAAIEAELAAGVSPSQAARQLAKNTPWSRSEIYALITTIQEENPRG